MLRHREMHQPDYAKKFACEQCDKTFGRKTSLQRHNKSHKKMEPFNCTIGQCSMAYADRRNLKAHIKRLHTDARPEDMQFKDGRRSKKKMIKKPQFKFVIPEPIRMPGPIALRGNDLGFPTVTQINQSAFQSFQAAPH